MDKVRRFKEVNTMITPEFEEWYVSQFPIDQQDYARSFLEDLKRRGTLRGTVDVPVKIQPKPKRKWHISARFIKIFLAVVILLTFSSVRICNSVYDKKYDAYYLAKANEYIREHSQAGTLMVEITIDTSQTEYKSLGTDISYEHTCNGFPISSGDTIRARSRLSFSTTITEHDSIDDVGNAEAEILLSYPYKATKTVSCKVQERGGKRYSNAYAVWDVTYSVSPIVDLDIGYWDVIFS